VEIKFRDADLVSAIRRLDPQASLLARQQAEPGLSEEERQKKQTELEKRECLVMPTYRSMAATFADLHDTPGRMHAKGTVRGVVEWRNARRFFYRRLRRRMSELLVWRKFREVDAAISVESVRTQLSDWVGVAHWDSDVDVAQWVEGHMDDVVRGAVADHAKRKKMEDLQVLCRESLSDVVGLVAESLKGCPEEKRSALRQLLSLAAAAPTPPT
jgi:hypothetical protein